MLNCYSGAVMSAGNIRWQIASTKWTHDEITGYDNRWETEDGVHINLHVLTVKTLLQASNEQVKHKVNDKTRSIIEQNDLKWLQIGYEVSVIDLDSFKAYFSSHIDWDWFHGSVELPTRVEVSESEWPDRIEYGLGLSLLITEEIVRKRNQFAGLVSDPILSHLLTSRWRESERTAAADAHLATVILLGSILEGVLLDIVKRHPEQANRTRSAPRDNDRVLPFSKWTLENLRQVAFECEWIGRSAFDSCEKVRDYRNLVHPNKQIESEIIPDYPLSHLVRQALEVTFADLRANIPIDE